MPDMMTPARVDLCALRDKMTESPGKHADMSMAIFPTEDPLTTNWEYFLTAVRLRHQRLGFLDRAHRIVERIDFRKNGHIQLIDVAARKFGEPGIDALAVFMAGRMKGGDAAFSARQQHIQQAGCFFLCSVKGAAR